MERGKKKGWKENSTESEGYCPPSEPLGGWTCQPCSPPAETGWIGQL